MRAVLVGAGHAHLHVIREADCFRRRGHELTIVAPGSFWYSGLATGMVGGRYPPELDCIDVAALGAQGGARFVRDRMAGLDRAARLVLLESGASVSYDVLSLDLGSAPATIPGPAQPGIYAVKPISRLRELRADLEERFRRGDEATRVVIAGGGATGAEIAANVAGLAHRLGAEASVTVLGGGRLLAQLPPGATQAALSVLRGRGIRFLADSHVGRLEPGRAMTESGAAHPFDIFVNATGLHPPQLLRDIGLPLRGGALLVDAHLRSPGDSRVHAGGDCVALEGHDLPRTGVYAVRQAPVLLHNLLAALDGTEPRRFVPQRRYLWILNLGDGTGLAVRGRLWWRGRSALWLKDRLDRRFLRRYRVEGFTGGGAG